VVTTDVEVVVAVVAVVAVAAVAAVAAVVCVFNHHTLQVCKLGNWRSEIITMYTNVPLPTARSKATRVVMNSYVTTC
jgi:hypothetical protein